MEIIEPYIGPLIGFALVAAMAWFVVSMFRGGARRFCASCGHLGRTRHQTRGSLAIEVILWLMFVVPGLIYTIWRHSTRTLVCHACGSINVIPPGSPMAVKMQQNLRPPVEK